MRHSILTGRTVPSKLHGAPLSQYVSGDIAYPEPSAHFDLYTKEDLPASDILGIIEFSDYRFEELTQCSAWDTRKQVHSLD